MLQGQNPAFEVIRLTQLSAVAQLSVPIYQGGGEYSAVRQSKETLGQQRLNLDVNRDQARATVVQSWGQLDAAKAQIESTTAQVNAAEIESFAKKHLSYDDASFVIVGDGRQFLADLKKEFPNVEVIPVDKLDLNSAKLVKP